MYSFTWDTFKNSMLEVKSIYPRAQPSLTRLLKDNISAHCWHDRTISRNAMFRLSSAGYLNLAHSFSVSSENITWISRGRVFRTPAPACEKQCSPNRGVSVSQLQQRFCGRVIILSFFDLDSGRPHPPLSFGPRLFTLVWRLPSISTVPGSTWPAGSQQHATTAWHRLPE